MAVFSFPPNPGEPGGRTESVAVAVAPAGPGLRRFTLRSSQAQRDDAPAERVVQEQPGDPQVHSGSPLFDALFAQAVDDARLNAVDAIRDPAYQGGQPIACRSYQTGERWPYVWTRDLAYAAHLGLAWLDAPRVAAGLRFKTSGWRAGVAAPPGLPPDSLQIVQDTGSGGSWPVSTDRVAWAWGAEAVLDALPSADRGPFADLAWQALRGALQADRVAAFDPRCGLYNGETSFLDWRTQNHPPWILNGLARLAAGKSLSTNLGHHQALRLAARLGAERGEDAEAAGYAAWADDLKAAIQRVFWLPEAGQYASRTTDDDPPVPLQQFDLLATALAVVSGVAPPACGAEALARYPHGPFGAPVLAPQLPGVPAYHNRALWPFVTAYAARAAARLHNPAVAGRALQSLMRAAALNLSNMENLEWLTGRPWFLDGPVINSRRQLWSVAGYLGVVIEQVFGLQRQGGGLRLRPFLTTTARQALGPGDTAVLSGLAWQGAALRVVLQLPPLPSAGTEGWYPLASVQLDGRPVAADIDALPPGQPGPQAHGLTLAFGPCQPGDGRLNALPPVDPGDLADPRVFSPSAPVLKRGGRSAAGLVLQLGDAADPGLTHTVYRDGRCVAQGVAGPAWTDPDPGPPGLHRHYTAVAVRAAPGPGAGLQSQPSEPLPWAEDALTEQPWPDAAGPGPAFTLAAPARLALALLYENPAHSLETGITNAVLGLQLLGLDGQVVAEGLVQLPHTDPDTRRPALSTAWVLALPAGMYRLRGRPYFNMSHLAAIARYGAAGGQAGPLNQARVRALQWVRLAPAEPGTAG